MKIILTGGGTAGHVMPHIAMLDEFRKHYDKIIYIGSKDGIEKDIIAKEKDIKYHPITTTKLVRNKIFKNLLIPFKLIKGVHDAKKILKAEKPNVIFSKGGFVSLPVVLSAKKLKIPVVAHESDLNLGLANKLSKHSATVICTTFEKTSNDIKNKGKFTGSPMRKDIKQDKALSKHKLGITTDKPILVVTGGSLGAKFLNDKIREELNKITKHFYVIHLTGKNNLNPSFKNTPNYKQIEFTNDMGLVLSCADLVVSRAGSNTIFELAVMNLPMLLVPLPKGNSRGDQVDNAKYFNEMGFANYVTQEQLESSDIFPFIMQTYKDSDKLKQTLKNAEIIPGNEKILKIILDVSKT